MKRIAKIAVCFASGLALNTGLCADNGLPPNNPYAPIVARNIFGLNPPQANGPPTAPEPPSKITPDGIMTIFGTPQVLFNVAVPPRPPTPATEKSYILSEGQRQDDIEVVHIDEKGSIVTFNNHGVVQEIPLVKAPPITTPTPVVPVVMNSGLAAPPGVPGGFNGPRAGNFPRFGSRPGQNNNVGNNGGNFGNNTGNLSGNNPGGNLGSTGYGSASTGATGSSGAATQPPLSPEEQMIMIAAQHAQAQKEGNPMAAIFPPTPLDQAAGVVTPNAPPAP